MCGEKTHKANEGGHLEARRARLLTVEYSTCNLQLTCFTLPSTPSANALKLCATHGTQLCLGQILLDSLIFVFQILCDFLAWQT